ncbi:unnamed protein product [Didymodactylos carnosus]|uniref:Mab-21-like HhH/H2TH-like domain-containing protein n=1 Tax=Didymodactylos carnosus TaxID=1234261 RepID=A0A814ELM7_9BILA|nr:unnamed protein product [Didymodactylos carnosus]CAF3741239.1 unnamed protein product [Didymodactylos carnosus]
MDEECDIVIGYKLKFWPKITNKRLETLQHTKPPIYKQIRDSSVYAIPKWCKHTSEEAARYEFHLSFSAVELTLVKLRTTIEKMLNRIARYIYYKHIRRDSDHIKSYVIKIIVLWMCEEFDLEHEFQNVHDEEIIAIELGKRFINFTLDKLNQHYCKHYFIDDVNIIFASGLAV